jgi:LCP family protein required for cell wall assembly
MDMLVIFDETNLRINMLYLNRDTMLTMPVLGLGGKEAGTYYGQLALAHTYGSGLEDSCENTRNTISAFLGGVRIDHYVSMNMDAVSLLNDLVGGVTVEVTEDFSAVDPTIGMGEVKLMGQQAINYVRTRKGVGDQLNLTRIQRQK